MVRPTHSPALTRQLAPKSRPRSAAERHAINLKGATVTIGKEMSADLPRRIIALRSVMTIPLPPDHPQRVLLEAAAKACPVKQSLAQEIDASVDFRWVG